MSRSFILLRDSMTGAERVLAPMEVVLVESEQGLEPAEAETLHLGEVVRCDGTRWVVRHGHAGEVAA